MLKRIISKKNRALLSEMIRTDFKLRYQGSVLGYLWSLLKPLMLFGIMYTVFTQFLRIGRGIPNYPISLLLGIVLWNFFNDAASSALKSIVGNGSLIRKINIPRYMIPVASISSAFINMLLNLVVIFLFVAFADNTPLSWQSLILFPLLLIELIIVSLSAGFFLSALYVKYRDIEHIWDIAKQALFYGSAIIFPLSLVKSEAVKRLLLLNPITQIVQDSRAMITYGGTTQINDVYSNPYVILVPIGFIALSLIVSSLYFRATSKYFAENI